MRLVLFAMIVLRSLVSSALPPADLVNEMMMQDNFTYKEGELTAARQTTSWGKKTSEANIKIFTARGENYRVEFAPTEASTQANPSWRLTESFFDAKAKRVQAKSSSFFNNGGRAVTECFGAVNPKADRDANKNWTPAGDMTCATASYRACKMVAEFFRDPNKLTDNNSKLGPDESRTRQFLLEAGLSSKDSSELIRLRSLVGKEKGGLGQVCSSYSEIMGRLTKLAAHNAGDDAGSYADLAKEGVKAAQDSVSSMPQWKRTEHILGAFSKLENPEGKGKNRQELDELAARLMASGNELLAAESLVRNCRSVKFLMQNSDGSTAASTKASAGAY